MNGKRNNVISKNKIGLAALYTGHTVYPTETPNRPELNDKIRNQKSEPHPPHTWPQIKIKSVTDMSLSASVCSRLQHQHETIYELIRGFSEDQLRLRLQPDKWSAFEQLAHLVSYQPVFMQRLQIIHQEDEPAFNQYVADKDPAFIAFCKRSLQDLLDDLLAQRAGITNYLMTLTEPATERTGHHPKYGSLTILEWTEFFLLHEAHHLFSIFMLTRSAQAGK